MSVKKKTPPAKSVASSKAISHHPPPPDSGRNLAHEQLNEFDQAVKLFRAQNFREARELFLRATEGPQKEVAHNARTHINMCDRRLAQPGLNLKTLDDHYNYAVERLNAQDLESARRHLGEALNLHAQDGHHPADHVYYALAVCAGLGGDARGAYENLKRAIEIDPKNRAAARQDPDFAGVSQQPVIQQLLYPEKNALH